MRKENQKILIIEDDKDINGLLATYLKEDGFRVEQAYSGLEGLPMISDQIILVLLDLMLPRMSGEEVLEEIRKISQVPVIIISGKVALEDKVNLLESGADDYITKPFARREVMARIHAALRRQYILQEKEDSHPYRYLDLVFDPASRDVHWKDKLITLTQTEFAVLHTMMQAPEEVHSRDTLYAKVWNTTYFGDDNAITVHMSRLRQKLKQASSLDFIETVWGIGYKFKRADTIEGTHADGN